jgi:hemerythrin-like domain-containing protein
MAPTPIKRKQQLIPLSKEHHFTLLFCWKIRQGLRMHIAGKRLQKYIKYFSEEHLAPHFKHEEELLFHTIRDKKVQDALDQHRQIREHIAEALQSDGENDFELFSALTNLVEAHVRYEERELFPHLETVLTEKELQWINEELQKEAIKQDDYQDEFWINKK